MILNIALKDLKIMFHDTKALAVIILMPIVLILILGSALGPMFQNQLAVDKFVIGVVNKDDGLLSQIFVNQVLRGEMSDMIDTYVINKPTADNMLKNKNASSVIYIPKGFTSSVNNNKEVTINIKSITDNSFNAKIVKSITEGFSKNVSLNYSASFAALQILDKYNIPLEVPIEGMSESMYVMSKLQENTTNKFLNFDTEEEQENKTINAKQFYSASMLVMFILFTANLGSKLFVEERENNTLLRIMSTTNNKVMLILGKLLSLFLMCIVQSSILILFTKYVFNVDWGQSLLGIIIITIFAVFAASGFGMLIASISKTSKAADGMGTIFIQVFTLIGGGMIPMYIFPPFLKKVAQFTPNWWAVKGYNDLMMGAGVTSVLPYCGFLILLSLVFLTIGIVGFRTN